MIKLIQNNKVLLMNTVHQGGIEIQLNPALLPGGALLVPQQGATAYLQAEQDNQNDPFALYGEVGGIRLKSKITDLRHPRAAELKNLTEEVWKKSKIFLKKFFNHDGKGRKVSFGKLEILLPDGRKIGIAECRKEIEKILMQSYPRASNLAIDLNTMTLRFLQDGNLREITQANLPSNAKEILDFISKMQEAHEAARETLGIGCWFSRLGTEANRPLHGDTPFKIGANTTFERFLPKTEEEFISKGHMKALLESLPEDKKQSASEQIQKTQSFITTFKRKIEAQIEEKKETTAPENEIAQLEKIKEKLENINLYAVYWAAAYWNSLDITPENQSKTAQDLTNGLIQTFESSRTLNKDKWSLPHQLPFFLLDGGKPEKDDLKSFAIQAGDLYFHSDLDYLTRYKGSGAIHMVRPSVEEFVIHNLMTLKQIDYVDDLTSFGMQTMDPQLQALVQKQIQETRLSIS